MGDARHILIVEDEPNVRIVFRMALESNDYMLSTAVDGESAPRWLEREPVDLVLLDLQMPGLGGMDVLRRLREKVEAALSRGSGRKSPSLPNPIATLRVQARRALEDGDLAKAEALVDGLAALESDSAEVRRLVDDFRSAREAADGPYRVRNWFP